MGVSSRADLLLVINGADDVHVPPQDTRVFEGRRDTQAVLVPGSGHCAISKFPEVIPVMFEWLATNLAMTGERTAAAE